MARRLELRTTTLEVEGLEPQPLLWGEMATRVLGSTEQGRGADMAEMLEALDAMRPIKEAMAKKAKSVTLTEEQYRLLRDKARTYRWGLINQTIADFLVAVRDAPEIGTEKPIPVADAAE